MFIHNLKYFFKIIFRNRMLIFWTFAFPIILGTFFNMAFSNIEKNERLDIIDIAIVDNQLFKDDEVMKNTFKELSNKKNKDQLFNTKYVDLNKAKELLSKNKVVGYLLLEDNNTQVVVLDNGIDETIFKYVVDEIIQTKEMLPDVIEYELLNSTKKDREVNINEMYSNINKMIQEDKSKIKDISKSNLSYTMIEFYTLIAMTCLYGGIIGMSAINMCLANMSNKGKRIEVSPICKTKIILSSLFASFIIQLIGLALLFIYTIFVLKVDYGSNILAIILLSLVGTLAGLSLGITTAVLVKKDENTKIGIMISTTMIGCVLSGMMGITMKYIIDKNIPIVNKLNPVNMITDGFYSLYYYSESNRFLFNVISLVIFSLFLILISSIRLRRNKYDNI
ncbi:MAG: ABC transporter permease [Bacilli bacterium]|nr:ABC transporter permease [Bacilli bacterium]